MSWDYSFVLPWPPSVNGYWRTFKGRQIVSKRGREYRESVGLMMSAAHMSDIAINERLQVKLLLEPPTRRKFDVDNFTKAVFDALTHCGFWVDDELVDDLRVVKHQKGHGSVTVLVRPVGS